MAWLRALLARLFVREVRTLRWSTKVAWKAAQRAAAMVDTLRQANDGLLTMLRTEAAAAGRYRLAWQSARGQASEMAHMADLIGNYMTTVESLRRQIVELNKEVWAAAGRAEQHAANAARLEDRLARAEGRPAFHPDTATVGRPT